MKTSEFIEKVEALPFVGGVEEYNLGILVLWDNDGNNILSSIDKGKFLNIRTDEIGFEDLTKYQQSELMVIAWAYISTPVNEREPEKKFRLKVKKELRLGATLVNQYLNYDREDDEIVFADGAHFCDFTTIFTDSELKELFTPEQLEWIEMTFYREVLEE